MSAVPRVRHGMPPRLDSWWDDELLHLESYRSAGTVPLTGRALLAACDQHVRAHANAEGDRLTIALCHSAVRKTARPGDVIILCASEQLRSSALSIPRGVQIVTHLAVVEETLGHAGYYSRVAPAWARGRADRIYALTASDVGQRRRSLDRDGQEAALRELDDGRNFVVRTCRERGRPATEWICGLRGGRGCKVRLRCRHDVRFHRAGTIPKKTRLRDFSGRILVCRSFHQFVGDAADARCLRLVDLTAARPSIGFTICPFDRRTTLRRRFEQEFPNHR